MSSIRLKDVKKYEYHRIGNQLEISDNQVMQCEPGNNNSRTVTNVFFGIELD